MDLLAKLLYLVGAVPTIGAIAILVILAPRPQSLREHLQGLARYLILAGAVFGAARVMTSAAPPWNAVVFMLGVGLALGIYARDRHLKALAADAGAA